MWRSFWTKFFLLLVEHTQTQIRGYQHMLRLPAGLFQDYKRLHTCMYIFVYNQNVRNSKTFATSGMCNEQEAAGLTRELFVWFN